MGVYKAKIQYDGSLDKLKLIIVVRGDMQITFHNIQITLEDP